MLEQKLEQKIEIKLTPQQIQMIKLLELPIMELEQRIKKEMDENPALEEKEDLDDDISFEEDNNDNQDDMAQNNEDEFSYEDYISDDDEIPVYKLQINNHSKDEDYKEIPYSDSRTFQESLKEQLYLKNINEKEKTIVQFLIGNIDEDGYIRRSSELITNDMAFLLNIEVSEQEIEKAFFIIQDLDPAGIGARDLQECLLIQLKKMETRNKIVELAQEIIENYFDEFTKKHYHKITAKLEIDEDTLKQAIDVILKLNPKPGNSYSDQKIMNHLAITPDFVVEIDGDDIIVSLNEKNTPELRISKNFSEMINELKDKNQESKKAISFIRQKIETAKWFIEALKQRQQTLLLTIEAIVSKQRDFFLSGDDSDLKPMVLKHIAEITGLDISTISRVANSKYVATPYGTFLLKYFFSEAMQTNSGEEVSSKEIKTILKNCVEAENKQKPLTDDKLAEILNDKGYQIARRTVAKYREQLDIPVARLRKKL